VVATDETAAFTDETAALSANADALRKILI